MASPKSVARRANGPGGKLARRPIRGKQAIPTKGGQSSAWRDKAKGAGASLGFHAKKKRGRSARNAPKAFGQKLLIVNLFTVQIDVQTLDLNFG